MAKLIAMGLLVAGPVRPVEPEFPVCACGLLTASDQEFPVLPLLVALDCAVAAPEFPDADVGLIATEVDPPTPPLALPTETLEPPTAVAAPDGARTMLAAGAPGPATGMAKPPEPPLPPTPTARTPLEAFPVRPDADTEVAPAPEFAALTAFPMAVAFPVLPESPESPDDAPPPTTTAVPRMAWLVADGLDVAAPVEPVEPELPEVATGFETAADEAFPVLPVLVALDWEVDAPELPVVADGLTTTFEPPPLPPLALPTATLEPPVADDEPEGAATTFTAAPPPDETGTATPPFPPLPPAETAVTVLVALPVEPDEDVDVAPAPELAELVALPTAVAEPVLPELPESPDEAWALAADAPIRSMKRATRPPPIVARATRTSVRNFAVLIVLFTSLHDPGAPLADRPGI